MRHSQPATTWEGRMFDSAGDTVSAQIPATVELLGVLFLQQLNKGATCRVVNGPPLMTLLFANPNPQLCGP
jgi:hypothetical protein